MLTLTREVRFAVNLPGGPAIPTKTHNSYAGFPPLLGVGMFFRIAVTVGGDLDPKSQYLLNIKQIDEAVRRHVVPHFTHRRMQGLLGAGARTLTECFELLSGPLKPARLLAIELFQTPFQSISVSAQELPMVKMSCLFEFSASHRLANPALSDAENLATFGKCSNPFGHGHNYQVKVTIQGEPDDRGQVMYLPDLEKIVDEAVINHFDHKHLNEQCTEFSATKGVLPTVENIAKVSYLRLKPLLKSRLTSVTVWETPKTFAEYSE